MKRPGVFGICLLVVAILTAALACLLLAGCGGEAATTEASTTTADVSTATTAAAANAEETPSYVKAIYGQMQGNSSGGPEFDLEKWKATEAHDVLIGFMGNSYKYRDQIDPELLAYWEALGMKKELHEADDENRAWASYTPLAALEEDNTTKYPVVFCFHGASRSIFQAEGYGIAEYGAEAGYITVCARTHLVMKPERVMEGDLTSTARVINILDDLEQGGYPIDRTRVYVTGESMGGMTCAWLAYEIPEVITAIAMHGSLWAFNTDPDAVGSDGLPSLSVTPDEYAKIMDYEMPVYLECGDSDHGQLPINTEGVISGLNLWLELNGCATRLSLADSLAAQENTSDPAVKLVGVVGDKNWTEEIYGVVYQGAEFYNADGVKMIELVGVENNPHWVSAAYPELAWEFMSRFSRDADGNIVVAE